MRQLKFLILEFILVLSAVYIPQSIAIAISNSSPFYPPYLIWTYQTALPIALFLQGVLVALYFKPFHLRNETKEEKQQ